MLRYYISFCCALIGFYTYSQSRGLGIGDTLLVTNLGKTINFKKPNASTSDFAGKWLILDFGNSTCKGCIKKFPLFDSLNKEFAEKVQVLIISNETQPQMKELLKRKKLDDSFSIPIIVEDTILSKSFPHASIPHVVWIDPNRVVRAITYSEYVTSHNISNALSGKVLDFPVKGDLDFTSYWYNKSYKSLMQVDNTELPVSYQKKPFFYSSLLRSLDGAMRTTKSLKDSIVHRQQWINYPVLYFLDYCFRDEQFTVNQLILNVKNPHQFSNQGDVPIPEWNSANTFCYEMHVPSFFTEIQKKSLLLRDIETYLGIKATIQKQLKTVYVLKAINDTAASRLDIKKINQQSVSHSNNYISLSNWLYEVNKPLNSLVYDSVACSLGFMIDESKLDRKLKSLIKLPQIDVCSIDVVNRVLGQFNLQVIKEQRLVSMLIVTDNVSSGVEP